tara:strand:- start:55 stop:636 length:582 start_codon:yes stop_codon:yes gene_type:complete
MFYANSYQPVGPVHVMSGDASVSNNSLEFKAYKSKLEAKLTSVGHTVTDDLSDAKYIAFFTYGIDDGKENTYSFAQIGQTGGGTTYSSGTVNSSGGGSATYSGSTYQMPTYGQVGTTNISVTTYKRIIAVDMVDAESVANEEPIIIYEGRTNSTGTCGVIGEVIDEMIEAMFTDFPSESGKNRTLRIPSVVDC